MPPEREGPPPVPERLRPPARETACGDPQPCVYEIDADDRIVALSDAWYRFARENGAGRELCEIAGGTSLWDLIRSEEVRDLYQRIFAGARAHGRPLRVPFRCDSPALRRYMELEISPRPGGGLVLAGQLLHAEPREPVELIANDGAAEVYAPVVLCSWCKAARLPDGRWGVVEELVRARGLFETSRIPRISHSICPDCQRSVRSLSRVSGG